MRHKSNRRATVDEKPSDELITTNSIVRVWTPCSSRVKRKACLMLTLALLTFQIGSQFLRYLRIVWQLGIEFDPTEKLARPRILCRRRVGRRGGQQIPLSHLHRYKYMPTGIYIVYVLCKILWWLERMEWLNCTIYTHVFCLHIYVSMGLCCFRGEAIFLVNFVYSIWLSNILSRKINPQKKNRVKKGENKNWRECWAQRWIPWPPGTGWSPPCRGADESAPCSSPGSRIHQPPEHIGSERERPAYKRLFCCWGLVRGTPPPWNGKALWL